jgi:hypothetical protein
MTTKKRLWKRSKPTTTLVHSIRRILNAAGYEEELATTPLQRVYSVIARKGEEGNFNVRIDKETLEIVSVHKLTYNVKKNNTRRVFREKMA